MPLTFCCSSLIRFKGASIVALALLIFFPAAVEAQRQISIRNNRYLTVWQLNGQVMLLQQASSRPARKGDRLDRVGDGIITGQGAQTILSVDLGIGFISISENTRVRVRSLSFAPDNGRITQLEVPSGQVRLQVRRFNHRGSRLEILTPSGVSAVRGTNFGVNVHPDGKTGIATAEGAVATVGQGQTVMVPAGFQNLTLPGEEPSPPQPLRNSTVLQYWVDRQIQNGIRRIQFTGQVDSVNTVFIKDKPQLTDRYGRFTLQLPALSSQTLWIEVLTPLGKRQIHPVVIKL